MSQTKLHVDKHIHLLLLIRKIYVGAKFEVFERSFPSADNTKLGE